MERDGGAAKVGAGETAGCEGCGLPLAQALGETGVCKCPGGLRDDGVEDEEKRKEDAKWFAETYLRIRARDQAALSELHALIDTHIAEAARRILAEWNKPHTQALVYRGHDMEPTIGVGDKVYYDSEIQVIDGDGLYALKPAGVVIARRLVAESDGRVRVVCDSPNKTLYPDQIYMTDELHLLNIVGKVIGYKRKGVTLPAD